MINSKLERLCESFFCLCAAISALFIKISFESHRKRFEPSRVESRHEKKRRTTEQPKIKTISYCLRCNELRSLWMLWRMAFNGNIWFSHAETEKKAATAATAAAEVTASKTRNANVYNYMFNGWMNKKHTHTTTVITEKWNKTNKKCEFHAHTQRTSKQEPAANGQMGARITMSMRNVKRSESGENNNNSEEEWNVKNLVKDWMRLGHVRP